MKGIALVLLLLVQSRTAGRFESGDLKGFSRSPSEHIIVTLNHTFTVKSVRGLVTADYDDSALLPEVLFELRGPGGSEKIWSGTTGDDGKFKISNVPEGRYRFKATFNGFQSVIGTVVVSKGSPQSKDEVIRIRLRIGV
jgi:hypothetical protein